MATKAAKQDAINYREGVKRDVESVATRAKTMTGKSASKLTNKQIAKANREHDAMDSRERNRVGAKKPTVLEKKLKGVRI